MFQAQKAAANSRRRTSLGRKFEATAEAIHTSHTLGDITNLVDDTWNAMKDGSTGRATGYIELVKKALPYLQSAVSDNAVKACPKGGTSVQYAVSRINKEEKKRKSIDSMHQRPSKRRHSDSFKAVQTYVRDNQKVAKGGTPATTSTPLPVTSQLPF